MVANNTRVIQVTNIAPQATKDQMQTLFGYLGKIDDIRLYPTIRDVSCPVQSRICYVKYYEASTVGVAQHMTNTVFIDRALIVIPVQSGEIPDEHKALEMSSNGTLVPGLNPSEPRLPPEVVNTLEGVPPNQVIQTHDPRLTANGLPNYPPLPAAYDSRKIEEIRRTILVIDVPHNITSQQLIDHFGTAGQVKYLRFCERDSDKLRYSLVEFSEQESLSKALKLNGSELEGHIIKVHHATQAISKPQTKSNEAAQREIEEAMCRVKEAQNLISAAIDPVIGMLSKDKRRSRRSRSRSRHRSRRSRSRSRRRTRHRSRSRSSRRRRSRSRSHGKSSKSKRERSKNRDTEKEKDKEKDKEKKKDEKAPSPSEKDSSVEKKRSSSVEPSKEKRRSRSREKKSRERKRSRSRDRDRKRSRSRERRRSRSRGKRRTKSRERRRTRSRDRKGSRSRDRKRSRSRERKRSRSRDRKRSKSKDRDRDRKRSHSKSKSKRRSLSPIIEKRREKDDNPKVSRDYDEEEQGFEADKASRKSEARSESPDPPSKDSPDNMDISNSP